MTVFLQCFVITRTEIGNEKKKDQRRVEASPRTALLLSSLSRVSGKSQAVLHPELLHHLRLKAITDTFAGLRPHLGLNMFVQARSLPMQLTSGHLVSLIHGLSHLKTIKSSWIWKQNMRIHVYLKNKSECKLSLVKQSCLKIHEVLLLAPPVRLYEYLGSLDHSFPE